MSEASVLPYTIVDAFTQVHLKGNPAAVIIFPESFSSLSDSKLQALTREFNLSNTAFVTPPKTSDPRTDRLVYGLRWFSPEMEVRLCGHATLASASVLFSRSASDVDTIAFNTLSGELIARKLKDGRIELELPAGELEEIVETGFRGKIQKALSNALGKEVKIKFTGGGKGKSFEIFLFVELEEGTKLEDVEVNLGPFSEILPYKAIIITTAIPNTTNSAVRFHSRLFAPYLGVPEDPVSGSPHCLLGPYWTKRFGIDYKEGNEMELVGKQVSKRSGEVGIVWNEEDGAKCRLRGWTALARRGEIFVP